MGEGERLKIIKVDAEENHSSELQHFTIWLQQECLIKRSERYKRWTRFMFSLPTTFIYPVI